MKQLLISFVVFGAWAPFQYADAQQKSKPTQQETITIQDDKNVSTIEIKDGDVYVDGKKVSPYDVSKNLKIIRKFGEGGTYEMRMRSGTGSNDGITMRKNFGDQPMQQSGQPMLGVKTDEVENGNGAKVLVVTENSPADLAGIASGDIITKVDNVAIASPQDLASAIASYKPADRVQITVLHNNEEKQVAVILAEKQNEQAESYGNIPGFEDMFKGFENMGGGFGNFGGFEKMFGSNFGNNAAPREAEGPKIGAEVEERADGEGLLITNIKEGSSAEKAGLKVGDVLSTIGGKKMTSVDDLSTTLYELKSKRDIAVNVKRGGKAQTLYIQIPTALRKREF